MIVLPLLTLSLLEQRPHLIWWPLFTTTAPPSALRKVLWQENNYVSLSVVDPKLFSLRGGRNYNCVNKLNLRMWGVHSWVKNNLKKKKKEIEIYRYPLKNSKNYHCKCYVFLWLLSLIPLPIPVLVYCTVNKCCESAAHWCGSGSVPKFWCGSGSYPTS
jgi:hypothetical protein